MLMKYRYTPALPFKPSQNIYKKTYYTPRDSNDKNRHIYKPLQYKKNNVSIIS